MVNQNFRRCRGFVKVFFASLIVFPFSGSATAAPVNWRFFVNGAEVFDPHPNNPGFAGDGDVGTKFLMSQNNQGGSAISDLTVRAEFMSPVFLNEINGRLGGGTRIDNGEDDQERTGRVEVRYFIEGIPTTIGLFSFADRSNGNTEYDSGDLSVAVNLANVESVEWRTIWGQFVNVTKGEGRLFTNAYVSEAKVTLAAIPEPSSIVLASLGAVAVVFFSHRARTNRHFRRRS